MRNVIGVPLLLFLACASQRGAQAPVALPEITIVQTAGVASAARNVTGPIVVGYAIRVANKASVPVTLKRIEMQTVGAGAYTLSPSPTSKPFDTTIAPDSYQDVQLSTGGFVSSNTVVGANGPVTLRLILFFDSPAGSFQHVVVQQVNDKLTGEIP